MASALVTLFHKNMACPSSQDLLEYDQARLSSSRSLRVETHLANCDFCSAELQLLNRYQNTQEEYSFAEMPLQLRRLAERLLHVTVAPFHTLQRREDGRST